MWREDGLWKCALIGDFNPAAVRVMVVQCAATWADLSLRDESVPNAQQEPDEDGLSIPTRYAINAQRLNTAVLGNVLVTTFCQEVCTTDVAPVPI